MERRFQLRRWPDGSPLRELAVVDTLYRDRIVRTYTDESCRDRKGALNAAHQDLRKWNADPPTLCPIWRGLDFEKVLKPDGSYELVPRPAEARIYYNTDDRHSLYADYEYRGL